jgi:release factor glutamine methyltransferase
MPEFSSDGAGARGASDVEHTSFGHLTIRFDDRVLRPRSWTAEQSRWAAELIPRSPAGAVLELCSGAGHIGLLAIALAPRPLVCVDVNEAAGEHVLANASAAGLAHLVDMRTARLDEALAEDERFSIVIADPPWVPRAEIGSFPEDPVLAIDGGDDGLDIARACLAVAARHLLPGGSALLQLGTASQAEALARDLPGPLVLADVRAFERGVVARVDRPSGA